MVVPFESFPFLWTVNDSRAVLEIAGRKNILSRYSCMDGQEDVRGPWTWPVNIWWGWWFKAVWMCYLIKLFISWRNPYRKFRAKILHKFLNRLSASRLLFNTRHDFINFLTLKFFLWAIKKYVFEFTRSLRIYGSLNSLLLVMFNSSWFCDFSWARSRASLESFLPSFVVVVVIEKRSSGI